MSLPFVVIIVTGLPVAGTINAPGMLIGDRIIQAAGIGLPGNASGIFEQIVTVNDQIQQIQGLGSITEISFNILAVRL